MMPYAVQSKTPQPTQRSHAATPAGSASSGGYDDLDLSGSGSSSGGGGGLRKRGMPSQHQPRSPAVGRGGQHHHALHDLSLHTVQSTPQTSRYATDDLSHTTTGSSLLRDPIAARYHSYGTDPLSEEVAAERRFEEAIDVEVQPRSSRDRAEMEAEI